MGFLDFLGGIGSIANTINDFASPVKSILGAIRGPETPPMPRKPQTPAAETYAIGLLKALAQPGNSLIKSLAAEELQNLMAGQQSSIRSMVLADRRERSMGRAPVFFDPERADENISFQLSRGGAKYAQQAQENAIARIMKAANVGNYADEQYGRSQDYLGALSERDETLAKMRQMGQLPNTMERLGSGLSGIQQILTSINNKTNATPTNTGYSGYGPFPNQYNFANGENLKFNQMRY